MEKIAYRIPELIEAGPVGKTKLYEAINSGALPAHKHGSRTIIMAEDYLAYLRSLPKYEPGK